ncbi:hypothetical protein [Streptomyces sp. NPDC087538]
MAPCGGDGDQRETYLAGVEQLYARGRARSPEAEDRAQVAGSRVKWPS